MASDKDIIQEQQHQINEYQKILNTLLQKPKIIAIVEAGPFEKEEMTFFRVLIQGNAAVVPVARLNPKEIKEIIVGTQVLMLEGSIVGVLPKELEKESKALDVQLTTWNQIGGLKSQIDNIRQLVEMPLKHADLAKDFGVKPSKGLLLYGPPGCGKTLIAKAIASMILESDKVDPRAFRYVKGAELLSMYVGATEQAIGEMFRSCREYMKETGNQSVIFIDEADALLPIRGSRRSSDVDKTIVPTFLSEMDGFDGDNPFILLSTNLPNSLDEAVIREGRIDVKIGISRPTVEDAEEIFAVHLNSVKCHDPKEVLSKSGAKSLFDLDLKDRVSGAMIQSVVTLACKSAMNRKITNSKDPSIGVILKDIDSALKLINYESN